MMAKRTKPKPGYGKILSAWDAPEGAGDPVGCVATSFTFKAEFFEDECLSRFLKLESDPTEDGPVYLIEREEKLAQVSCAAALVDQHHCRGSRNMRWDLLAARVPRGILHAKVCVLHWAGWLRVIVSSANLTEDGYRRNQEIYGVLDYHEGGEAPLECLYDLVAFLRSAGEHAEASETRSPAASRWNSFLDRAALISQDWGVQQEKGRHAVSVLAVTTGKNHSDVFDQLKKCWRGLPPWYASVTSPFFDPPEEENKAAKRLWGLLRQRGGADVDFYAAGEDIPDRPGHVLLQAPRSLLKAEPNGRSQVNTGFYRVQLEENRALHAKTLWLENDRWVLRMIGSSNFTSAGYGLPGRGNIEANLAYLVDADNAKKAYKQVQASLLEGDKLEPEHIHWQPIADEGELETREQVALPSFFEAATYDHDNRSGGRIELRFSGEGPSGWCLSADDQADLIYDEEAWQTGGARCCVVLPWHKSNKRPPSGIEVRWEGIDTPAWWPVNIRSMADLPPPEELKDLPFEVLLDILTSARPLHKAMRAYLKSKKRGDTATLELDPHKRVDTSAFLLQRTRRVSWALAALRERLSRPASTETCLQWRLRGPVGVIALAQALQREAKSEEERAFLIAELALELARVAPRPGPGCLPVKHVRSELHGVARELRELLPGDLANDAPNLSGYVEGVFVEIGT